MWAAGYPIDWSDVLPKGERIVSLPHYPWQRERHWVATAEIRSAATNPRTVRTAIDKESQDLLFNLTWEASDLGNANETKLAPDFRWLVVSADLQAGSAMADALRSVGAAATSAPIEQLETMLEMHARGAASSFGIIVFAPDSEDAPYLPVRLLQAVMKTKWSANRNFGW